MVTALRSLLHFLFVTGRIGRELAAAVPTVISRKLGTLPGRLRAGEAGLLLGSCDRDTEADRPGSGALPKRITRRKSSSVTAIRQMPVPVRR